MQKRDRLTNMYLYTLLISFFHTHTPIREYAAGTALKASAQEHFQALSRFAKDNSNCRRRMIREYFGEGVNDPAGDVCPIMTRYQTHPINISYQHILSTHAINTPCRHSLSTPTPYQHTLPRSTQPHKLTHMILMKPSFLSHRHKM